MHEVSAVVRVWPDQPTPASDFQRCVFAACVAGVLAAELTFYDDDGNELPKGFEPLRDRRNAGVMLPR